MKRDKHSEIVEHRASKSVTYRKAFARTLRQVDLGLLVREIREDAELTQVELAKRLRRHNRRLPLLKMPKIPAIR